jgi:hypothetical protein
MRSASSAVSLSATMRETPMPCSKTTAKPILTGCTLYAIKYLAVMVADGHHRAPPNGAMPPTKGGISALFDI